MIIEYVHDWECPLVSVFDNVRRNDWVYIGERLEGCECVKAILETYWARHRIEHDYLND